MRIPIEWLADYVHSNLPTHELAGRMTMAGLKVESIEHVGEAWQDVVIGEVVGLDPHPSSNKPLHVAKVNVGDANITVVTGAQNVRLGNHVPVVLVGGLLPYGPDGEPMIITAKPMAGITSQGMLASAQELGISEEHSGIYVLPSDAPPGEPLKTVMGGDVLDVETNPNRPDTLSIIGIAREVAAMTQQRVTLPNLDTLGDNVDWLDEESIEVRVQDVDLCPRYTAVRIEGVVQRESPGWMVRRLEASGMRPISLLVDITNYVMLEYGQPMHAFDAGKVHGGIEVRRARAGERLRTLDGVDRTLSGEDLVIADAHGVIGLAGVMGGENTEIGDDTRAIILESATFDGPSVRRTAQSLALRSEASSRFEKGLPTEQTVPASRRFVQLLAQITGRPLHVARMADAWGDRPEPRSVRMPMRDLHRLSGLPIPRDVAAEKLSLLEFDVHTHDDAVVAGVPFWRRADVSISADLVEEVVRLVGYDTVPSTLPRRTLPPPPSRPDHYWNDVIRERLLGSGVNEVVTGTLTSESSMTRLLRHSGHMPIDWTPLVVNPAGVGSHEALVQPLKLLNPPTQDRDHLRLTFLPQLIDVVAQNSKHTGEGLAFFEIASTYFVRPADLPYERRTLGIALGGARRPRSWQVPGPGTFTFYDLKGLLVALLSDLQIDDWTVEAAQRPFLHPGRSAVLRLVGRDVALFGELHPLMAERFGIDAFPVQVTEIDLDSCFAAASDVYVFHPLPRYPAAHRDVAVVVPLDLPAEHILRVVREAGAALVEAASIFDVYTGDPLPAHAKSVAVEMQLRAPGATLTQEDIASVMERITVALQRELGATLRE